MPAPTTIPTIPEARGAIALAILAADTTETVDEALDLAGLVAGLARQEEARARGQRTPTVRALGAARVSLDRAGGGYIPVDRARVLASASLRTALAALRREGTP